MASKITLKNLEQAEFSIQHPDGVGAGTIKSTDITYKVDYVEDLINIPSAFDTVIVKDKDRGGVFNKITSTTANDGTIFDGDGCSWERQYSGAVNVDWFITDVNDVASALVSASLVGDILLGEKEYPIITKASITNGISITGTGNSSFLFGTGGKISFDNSGGSGYMEGVSCKDFICKGTDNTADGIETYLVTSATFDNIKFEKMNKCFIQRRTSTTLITNCGNTDIEDSTTDSNYFVWSDSTLTERSNDNIYSFNKVRTVNETLYLGSLIGGGSQDGTNVHGNIFFPNQNGDIIFIENARWSTVENNKIFASARHGVNISGAIHVTINNNVFATCGRKAPTGELGNAINVYSTAGGFGTTYGDVNITDNLIVQSVFHGIYVSKIRAGNIIGNVIVNPSDTEQNSTSDVASLNTYDGIHCEYLFNFKISNNQITTGRSGFTESSRPVTWNNELSVDTNSLYNTIEHINYDATYSTKVEDFTYSKEGGIDIITENLDVALTADDKLGMFGFKSNDPSGLGVGIKGSISVKSIDASGYSYKMVFGTTFGGDASNNKDKLYLGHTGNLTPASDNAQTLGSASLRWSEVFAGTGTINTSDDRLKTYLSITDVEKQVALELKANMKKFKFNNSIEKKGDNARIHFGSSAQTVKSIFEKHGLVAEKYSLLCYDEWYELDGKEVFADKDGKYPDGAIKLNSYGLRYEELLSFILSAI